MLASVERAIRERERLATASPWEPTRTVGETGRLATMPNGMHVLFAFGPNAGLSVAQACDNIAFAARARADIPALLAELDWLRQLLHDAREDSLAYQAGFRDGRESVAPAPEE